MRPNNRVKNPNSLSNLRRDKNGEITFASPELYQYELDRAKGYLPPAVELRRIGICLEKGKLSRRERSRLLYRTRKITNSLSTPRQTKVWKALRKMESYINKVEKELTQEGLLP